MDDALPEMLLVPVLVPLLVADTRALDVADVVSSEVADVDAVDGKVLVTEVALPDVALDVAVYNALPEVLLVSVLVRVLEADPFAVEDAVVVWLDIAEALALDGAEDVPVVVALLVTLELTLEVIDEVTRSEALVVADEVTDIVAVLLWLDVAL